MLSAACLYLHKNMVPTEAAFRDGFGEAKLQYKKFILILLIRKILFSKCPWEMLPHKIMKRSGVKGLFG